MVGWRRDLTENPWCGEEIEKVEAKLQEDPGNFSVGDHFDRFLANPAPPVKLKAVGLTKYQDRSYTLYSLEEKSDGAGPATVSCS